MAERIGGIHDNTAATSTAGPILIFEMITPINICTESPTIAVGRNRIEDCVAERRCTSDACEWTESQSFKQDVIPWNQKVSNASVALKAPQRKKTSRQIDVKTLLRHSELGMIAGRPSFSCRCTHVAKAGTSRTPSVRVAIVAGSLMLATVPVRALRIISTSTLLGPFYLRKHIGKKSQ